MRILIDQNIQRNAVTHRSVVTAETFSWGGQLIELPILKRKSFPPRKDEHFRLAQIPYLATLCLLAKQNRIEFYISFELMMERGRHRNKCPGYVGINLLEGVPLRWVKSPIDRKVVFGGPYGGVGLTEDDQMKFFQSITNTRYREICKALGNSHIDDAFHYWTAESAGLECFLTMDNKFLDQLNKAINQSRLCSSISAMTPREMCEKLREGPTDMDQLVKELQPFR